MPCSPKGPKLCKKEECLICYNRSFANFKGKTPNGKLIVNCWNHEKNGELKPHYIGRTSPTIAWFNCDNEKCNHKFQGKITNITRDNNNSWCSYCYNHRYIICGDRSCNFCFERSFASFQGKTPSGKLFIDCWDKDKNEGKEPINITKKNKNKFWFKCDNCPHYILKSPGKLFSENTWCSHCTKNKMNQNLCQDSNCDYCFNKSFDSFQGKTPKGKLIIDCWNKEKNDNKTPREILKGSNKEYIFNCDKCPHTIKKIIYCITLQNTWCPYCTNQKFCEDYLKNYTSCEICFNKNFASFQGKTPKGKLIVECWNKEKNSNSSPYYEFLHTAHKFYFDCDNCHHSYLKSLCDLSCKNPSFCPHHNNKTETILLNWLNDNFPNAFISQFRTEWCKSLQTDYYLPFDFFCKELELIIELDGDQHFKQVSNWKSPEEIHKRDIFKMEKAIKNGFSMIRILQENVWEDKNNWQNKLKNAIQTIKNSNKLKFIFIDNEKNRYTNHKRHYENIMDI